MGMEQVPALGTVFGGEEALCSSHEWSEAPSA